VVHVLPLRRSAQDIFSGANILIRATAFNASNLVPSPTILTALFDLTPSEARLAVALTQGSSLKAFAAEAGITFGTTRKYLELVCHKTGTHSQGQLVALLKSAQPLGRHG
jgi:DNA-binding CsgD family transcriptional regulator